MTYRVQQRSGAPLATTAEVADANNQDTRPQEPIEAPVVPKLITANGEIGSQPETNKEPAKDNGADAQVPAADQVTTLFEWGAAMYKLQREAPDSPAIPKPAKAGGGSDGQTEAKNQPAKKNGADVQPSALRSGDGSVAAPATGGLFGATAFEASTSAFTSVPTTATTLLAPTPGSASTIPPAFGSTVSSMPDTRCTGMPWPKAPPAREPPGTHTTPFCGYVKKEVNGYMAVYPSISFQDVYKTFSPEELRLKDYSLGCRFPLKLVPEPFSFGTPGARPCLSGPGGSLSLQVPSATAPTMTPTPVFGGFKPASTNVPSSLSPAELVPFGTPVSAFCFPAASTSASPAAQPSVAGSFIGGGQSSPAGPAGGHPESTATEGWKRNSDHFEKKTHTSDSPNINNAAEPPCEDSNVDSDTAKTTSAGGDGGAAAPSAPAPSDLPVKKESQPANASPFASSAPQSNHVIQPTPSVFSFGGANQAGNSMFGGSLLAQPPSSSQSSSSSPKPNGGLFGGGFHGGSPVPSTPAIPASPEQQGLSFFKGWTRCQCCDKDFANFDNEDLKCRYHPGEFTSHCGRSIFHSSNFVDV